jgi:hypothetical protein
MFDADARGCRVVTITVASFAAFSTQACSEDVLDHGQAVTTANYPSEPPARICEAQTWLGGPSSAPAGAVLVPAGDNSAVDFGKADTSYWLAAGVHTLGPDLLAQIVPGDNSTFIGAPGAILDGQGVNQFAFTQHAVNVRIAYLEIRNFVAPNDEAVVNHDGGTGWVIENNYLHDNGGAAVFVSSYGALRSNCLSDNSQYGFQGIGPGDGGSGINLVIDRNEVSHNGTGIGGGGAKLWNINGAAVTNNWIHENLGTGLSIDTNSRDFLIEGNYLSDNFAEAIYYGISYNAQIRRNNFERNALGKGAEFAARSDPFPVAAIYISESGGDDRVAGNPALEISENAFQDNWGGVTLWENANRFCASPDNTSAGYCTIVGSVATLATCVQPEIAREPLYDDCRWKTQNVSVRDNDFRVAPDAIGCTGELCARQALISNAGTSPSWSPYLGTVIQDAITFEQNNHFSNNRYFGPWRFMAHDTSVTLDFAAWQAAPYHQDQSSTLEQGSPPL